MTKIKVLHINNLYTDNYYLNNLCDNINRNEIELVFATFYPNCAFVEGVKKRNFNTYALDTLKRKQYPKALKKLYEIIKKEKPDILHLHLFEPTLIGMIVGKICKRKMVLTRHHSDALHLIESSFKRKFYLFLERIVNSQMDAIIAPSKMVKEILVEKENVQKEKVVKIPYGQTFDRFSSFTKEDIEEKRKELKMEGKISLLCVSRLFPRKGHYYLITAFHKIIKKYPNAELYLLGDDDNYKDKLIELAKKLGVLDKINFLGLRFDALPIMSAVDIVVHPSLEDALSSALIEAVMIGKPLIATDISGARDTLKEGEFGILIPPEDSEAIYDAVDKVIQNLEIFKEKNREGKKYLLEYMSAKRVAEEYTKVYQKVLSL